MMVKKNGRSHPYTAYSWPHHLPNLVAWFRFGVGITVTGQGVSTWADQSGNGRDLLQATDGARPLLQANNSILFNGTDEFLKCSAFTLNQPETVYWLGKTITHTATDGLWAGNASGGGGLLQAVGSPNLTVNAGASIASNADLAVGVYGVVSVVINGANSLSQVNYNTPVTGDAGAGNMGGFALGQNAAGNAFGNIQVKEVIVFSAAHDALTRKRITRYLKEKVGFE